jgi:uncharacterized protein (TIGR03437 family)
MNRTVKGLPLAIYILLGIAATLDPAAWGNVRAPSPKVKKTAQGQVPTFSREVVRILQKHCQSCHHPGDIAPFSMMSYQETRPWAVAIREAVITRKMPPWKPAPGCGEFRDVRQLTEEEIATLTQWVEAGAPEGDPADLPPPLSFPDGWTLGLPDLIITPETDYTPPTGKDTYRCFSVPTALRGDRFVSAIDVRPGNRLIVHHVIAYLDTSGISADLDAKDPGPGYSCFGGPGFDNANTLGGWAPGARPYFLVDGVGSRLPNNARVVLQVHYHPAGNPESDRTQLGLYFSKAPVRKELRYAPVLNTTFRIPPGEKRYQVTASLPPFLVPDVHLISITPHMHLLGREMKVEFTPPGQATQCLIHITDWDFNWQGTYNYQQPVAIPANSNIKVTAYYDNSASNPNNPNSPPKEVRWGEETTDEMCIVFLGYTLDAENLPISSPQLTEVTVDQDNSLIVNGSGFLPGAEIEINGRTLSDTRVEAASSSSKLISSELWRVYAPPGQPVEVTVLNPDGVRSAAKTFTRAGTALSLAAVSAASYALESVAPEAIVAAFGSRLATTTAAATRLPLPTSLGGTSVQVNGVPAPLFFVSPLQVNFMIPSATQTGTAVIEITASDGTLSRGTLEITTTAPSIFTANAQGHGAPAALVTADGLSYRVVGNPDGTSNEVNTGEYLVLFGTGIRRAARGTVKITIGGISAPVHYFGAQRDFVGLDQINTQIPSGVSGLVDLVVSVSERKANPVKVRIK